jgi:hypothetical protein
MIPDALQYDGYYGWYRIHSSIFKTLQSLQVDEEGEPLTASSAPPESGELLYVARVTTANARAVAHCSQGSLYPESCSSYSGHPASAPTRDTGAAFSGTKSSGRVLSDRPVSRTTRAEETHKAAFTPPQQTHPTLIEECDEPSVDHKADHLPHKSLNRSWTLDEESDEPLVKPESDSLAVIPQTNRLSPKPLTLSLDVIARSNHARFFSEVRKDETLNLSFCEKDPPEPSAVPTPVFHRGAPLQVPSRPLCSCACGCRKRPSRRIDCRICHCQEEPGCCQDETHKDLCHWCAPYVPSNPPREDLSVSQLLPNGPGACDIAIALQCNTTHKPFHDQYCGVLPYTTSAGSISQGSYGWYLIHSSVFKTLHSVQVNEDGGPPCAEGNNGWRFIHDSVFNALSISQGVEDGESLTDAGHLEHAIAQDVRPATGDKMTSEAHDGC